jgi:hypothetical protein
MEASFDLVSILFVESDHVATDHASGWPDESLHVLGLLRRDDDSAVLAFDTCRDAVRGGCEGPREGRYVGTFGAHVACDGRLTSLPPVRHPVTELSPTSHRR